MNYRVIFNMLGKMLMIESVLLVFPLAISFIYRENSYLAFLLPMIILFLIGFPLVKIKVRDKQIYAKEGFIIVALAWIFLSLFGALPFVISGDIPNYVDAFFETVSGFTTTGSTALVDVEILKRSTSFWRSFTHWIGGMGILVFALAFMPENDSGIMHVFRTESPGPSVGKLVSKLKVTARILYLIYTALTLTLIVFLLLGRMPVFDSIVHAFAVAGTGGFSIKNLSIAAYNSVYLEMVIAIFMLIFSINFSLYYLILIKNFKKALINEELRTFAIILFVAIFSIVLNLLSSGMQFGKALRYTIFQVSSISSTTGFSTADFNTWPAYSKGVLVLLSVIGTMAGSTGGGIKVSRLIVLSKSGMKDIKTMLNPRAIATVKYENQPLDRQVERGVRTYFIFWVIIVGLSTLLLSLDFNDLYTNFTASIACIGNVGPGLGEVGPMGNFAFYSPFSKILLSFVMLAGRLEIFPMLILFSPRTWKKG